MIKRMPPYDQMGGNVITLCETARRDASRRHRAQHYEGRRARATRRALLATRDPLPVTRAAGSNHAICMRHPGRYACPFGRASIPGAPPAGEVVALEQAPWRGPRKSSLGGIKSSHTGNQELTRGENRNG